MRVVDALKRTGFQGNISATGDYITTGSQATFIFNAPSGTLTIDWGGGSSNNNLSLSGIEQEITKIYDYTATRGITLSNTANPLLTKIECSSNLFTSADISVNVLLEYFDCNDNTLPSSEINAHLAQLVANGLSNGTYISNGQTPSAPPTGQGITDAATLVSAGWTVTTD